MANTHRHGAASVSLSIQIDHNDGFCTCTDAGGSEGRWAQGQPCECLQRGPSMDAHLFSVLALARTLERVDDGRAPAHVNVRMDLALCIVPDPGRCWRQWRQGTHLPSSTSTLAPVVVRTAAARASMHEHAAAAPIMRLGSARTAAVAWRHPVNTPSPHVPLTPHRLGNTNKKNKEEILVLFYVSSTFHLSCTLAATQVQKQANTALRNSQASYMPASQGAEVDAPGEPGSLAAPNRC